MDSIEIMKDICKEMNIEWDENATSLEVNGKELPEKDILEYLEYAFSGAKMMDDYETQLRISRAINAFQLDICEDCIIVNGCYCQNCKRCDGFYFENTADKEMGICKINMMAVKPDGFCNYGVPRK